MSNDDRIDRLETELKRMTRRNRQLICVACAFGILLVVARSYVPIPLVASEVRAGRIILEDMRGIVRADLSVPHDDMNIPGEARILLYDFWGNERISLTTDVDSPSLVFLDGKEKKRVRLQLNMNGDSCLDLTDQQEKTRVLLSSFDGTGNLSFLDGNGKTKWELPH